MGRYGILDDGGGDVLAAPNDDLGLTADNGEIAVLVDGGDIGVQGESIGCEQLGVGRRVVVVAETERRPPATGLAPPGAGDIGPVVEQPDLGSG